jgi:hypothetical protein
VSLPTIHHQTHNIIIEPFAGSAGYSLRYPDRKVRLYDADPIICGVWDYLIHVSPEEIRALPVDFYYIEELKIIPEAKALIGFCCNKGTTSPGKSPSKWMRTDGKASSCNYWSPAKKELVATQVPRIRHWTATQSSYLDIPNQSATWFIDPPYEVAGRAYKFHDIDYPALGDWCRSRSGQVTVCENAGADWLPFRPFRIIKGLEGRRGGKKSEEVIWTFDERPTSPAAVPVGIWQPSSSTDPVANIERYR